jgi:hypothetical protein
MGKCFLKGLLGLGRTKSREKNEVRYILTPVPVKIVMYEGEGIVTAENYYAESQ